MKAKTKRKFEKIVMVLLVLVFLLGWSLLLYLPQSNGVQTAPPVTPAPAVSQAPATSTTVQTAAPGP